MQFFANITCMKWDHNCFSILSLIFYFRIVISAQYQCETDKTLMKNVQDKSWSALLTDQLELLNSECGQLCVKLLNRELLTEEAGQWCAVYFPNNDCCTKHPIDFLPLRLITNSPKLNTMHLQAGNNKTDTHYGEWVQKGEMPEKFFILITLE